MKTTKSTIRVNGYEFILVEAESLSLEDDFMRHTPKTNQEETFKELLKKVIKSGISDFYRPKIDPSFDKHGEICYQAGLKPAVGENYCWWEENAKEFCPERKSRLGTKSQYVAFLGVLIKKLVECGCTIDEAWNAVCNDSRKLGHYWNSEGALHTFETTGSREICGFFDLANTFKILAVDKEAGGFWLAGGDHISMCSDFPLASLNLHYRRYLWNSRSIGWLVLEK